MYVEFAIVPYSMSRRWAQAMFRELSARVTLQARFLAFLESRADSEI